MKFSEHFDRHGVVHLWWTIGVLVCVVIALLSMKLGTENSIKDVLNFALALASLLLALVAIIQALISGGEFNRALGGVATAVAEIRHPAQQLAEAAFVIGRYSENIGTHASEIRERTTRLLAQSELVPESSVKSERSYSAEDVLPLLSPMACLALFLCLRSYESGRPVPSTALKDSNSTYWVWGYINALSNLSLIGIVRDGDYAYVRDLGPFSWVGERRQQIQGTASLLADESPLKFFSEIEEHFAPPAGGPAETESGNSK